MSGPPGVPAPSLFESLFLAKEGVFADDLLSRFVPRLCASESFLATFTFSMVVCTLLLAGFIGGGLALF